jgi:hypothetical protein
MEEFKQWLKRSVKLGDPSAKDVASRVRRASGFVNLDSKQSTEDLLHAMSKHHEFKQLSVFVRSQLRRAVTLYREYNDRA